MRLSIRQKLLGAFAVDLLLMIGLGVFALHQMGSMNRQASQVESRTIPSLRNADEVRGLITRYRSSQLEYLILTNDADRARLERAMAELESEMSTALVDHEALLDEEVERRVWTLLRLAWSDYVEANHQRFLPAVRRSNTGTVQPALSRLNPLYDRLWSQAERLADLGEERATTAAAAVQARYQTSSRFIVVDTFVSLVVSAAVGLLLASTLAQRIGMLRKATRRVAAGDLETSVESRAPDDEVFRDELTDLGHNFDRMVDSLRRQHQILEHRNSELRSSLEQEERLRRDLLERTAAEEQAVRARAEAEAASSAKSLFLATMSHELRTPLNAILGYAQVMSLEAEMRGEDRPRRDVDRILAAGRHLMTLINNVLDFSKIEQGRMEVEVLTFDLGEVVREVTSILEPMAAEKGNRLRVVGAEVAGTMRSDAAKVRQVLFNLLSNAVKFTEGGEVRVEVERAAETADWLRIAVHDTGIGIDEEQMGQLFEPFRQADASIRRRFGGTGLGLVVSRQICRLLGGELRAESVLGEGSTFTARLPATWNAENHDLDDSAEPVARPVGLIQSRRRSVHSNA